MPALKDRAKEQHYQHLLIAFLGNFRQGNASNKVRVVDVSGERVGVFMPA